MQVFGDVFLKKVVVSRQLSGLSRQLSAVSCRQSVVSGFELF